MTKKTKIKAIMWDMGGVFIRTFDPRPRRKLEQLFGLDDGSIDYLVFNSNASKKASLGYISVDEMWEQILDEIKIPKERREELIELFWKGDGADEKLLNYIKKLRQKHLTGLISNAWFDARRILSEEYHCMDAFDLAVFSAEVGIMKPDPAIYWHMLNELKIMPEESIFIDDFIENVESAGKIGINAVLFTDREQAVNDVNLLLRVE